MPEAPDLYLVRLGLVTRRLFELGRRRRLPLRDLDLDYLVHCQLGELFGGHSLSPFRIVGTEGRRIELLAYAPLSSDALEEHARTFADPGAWSACDWGSFAAKPMPRSWPKGRRLGYEVRVCPVLRKAGEGPKHRPGAEVDVFLARAWEEPDVELDRGAVYADWLRKRLAERGAGLLEARLERFRLARLLRRRQGRDRTTAAFDRPDALLRGTLEVTDGQAFYDLLRRGVGRHRGFGFGMLLLRPAQE